MRSSALNSPPAVRANIEIMRALVRRRWLQHFSVVFEAIRELMRPPFAPRERIGFRV